MSEDLVDIDRDEIGEVLSALERLMRAVASPVVRACLEEARGDIARLTGLDALPTGYERAAA